MNTRLLFLLIPDSLLTTSYLKDCNSELQDEVGHRPVVECVSNEDGHAAIVCYILKVSH